MNLFKQLYNTIKSVLKIRASKELEEKVKEELKLADPVNGREIVEKFKRRRITKDNK